MNYTQHELRLCYLITYTARFFRSAKYISHKAVALWLLQVEVTCCYCNRSYGECLALPVQNYLQPVQRQTRRSHSGAYIEYQSRLDCFKFSFLPRTTKDWNNLPPSISNITDPGQFKSAVTNYLQARDKNIRD